jgi:hypothetical protein
MKIGGARSAGAFMGVSRLPSCPLLGWRLLLQQGNAEQGLQAAYKNRSSAKYPILNTIIYPLWRTGLQD